MECRVSPCRIGSVDWERERVLSEGDINQIVLPEMGQLLGIVTQMFGYDRIMVKCSDGADRVCRIRGKMKRRVWVKTGDVVLVAPWDFQTSRGRALALHTEPSAGTSKQRPTYDVTWQMQCRPAMRTEKLLCPSCFSVYGKDQCSRSPA